MQRKNTETTQTSPFSSSDEVLVVDDEPFVRALVAKMLREIGAKNVETAENGAEALFILSDKPSHRLIVCDLDMPFINGLELLKLIRTGRAGIRRDVPMIMLTGLADQALVGAAIALDADSFVVKPIPKNTLDAHVRKILAGKRGAKAPDAYLRTDTSVVAPRKEIASVNSTAVSPSDLRTGDVLAAPLRTRNGALLLPAESALTEAIIARISELFAAGLHDGKIEIRLGPA